MPVVHVTSVSVSLSKTEESTFVKQPESNYVSRVHSAPKH